MRHILHFFFLFTCALQAQNTTLLISDHPVYRGSVTPEQIGLIALDSVRGIYIDSGWQSDATVLSTGLDFAPITGMGTFMNSGTHLDCVPWESFSKWVPQFEGDSLCEHQWIEAEFEDLNTSSNITLAVYCPCSCDETVHQGRICAKCYRDEYRDRMYGYSVRVKESLFTTLKHKQPDRR